MNDHQDSENFAYDKGWDEILTMLDKVEREQNWHYTQVKICEKEHRMHHMRNYKGLQGAVNALRWVLGDIHVDSDEVLGRD